MTITSEMGQETDLRKDVVTCLSISVISDEFRKQETKTKDDQRKSDDPKSGENTPENLVNSQHQLSKQSDNGQPKMLFQVFGAIVVSLTHLGIGAIYGFPGVTMPQLTDPDSDDIYLSTSDAALFGSLVSVGAVIGAMTTGPIVARIGLRTSMLVALPITLVFWIVLAFSQNVVMLLAARVCLGAMSSTLMTPSNTYVLEISHKDYRGILFGCIPTARQFGYLFVYSFGKSVLSWRYIALVCGTVTTAIPFIGLFFFPESPRWLVTRGREKAAEKSLLFFRGERYDYKSELDAIISDVKLTKTENKCNQCSQLQQFWKLVLSLSFLTLIVGFNGSVAVTTYLVPIFQSSTSALDSYTCAILVGAIRVVGTVINLGVVDRVGRRPIHLGSYIFITLCHAALGLYYYFQNIEWVATNLNWVPLVSLLVYTFFVGFGQPVLFMMHGELLPTNIRSLGYSILTTVLFTGAFLVALLFPVMTETLGEHGTFWVYSLCCLIALVYSYITIPETSGSSLEEIDRGGKDKNDSTRT